MSKKFKLFSLLFFVAVFATIRPGLEALAAVPGEITVQYDLMRNGSVMVEVSEQLRQGDGRYRIDSDAKGKGILALSNRGSVRRSSEGEIAAGGIRPIEFRDRRGNGPQATARFDWSARRVTQEYEGRTDTAELKGLVQDRLSFLWEFVFRPLPDKGFTVLLADGRGTNLVRYRVAGREKLETPAGTLDTLRIVKELDPGDERGTEIWFAVQRHNLPVRVLVTEKDGTRLDQVVTRIVP